jgi:hypothetical protein
MFNGSHSSGAGNNLKPRLAQRMRTCVRLAVTVAGLLFLSALGQVPGQAPAAKPARWTILFRSADPALWDTDARGANGKQIAIPLKWAPATFKYLRLRRMDTGAAIIIPLTRDQLENAKLPKSEAGTWWNGSNKDEYKGRHLGIVQGPRNKWPELKDLVAVMNDGWDGFGGSGFGHKCFFNDGQHYCWRGREIGWTVFEIAVSDGPLGSNEMGSLVASSTPAGAETTILAANAPATVSRKSPKAAALDSASARLTRTNFDQIQNGMTEDEVTAILGPPGGSSTRTVNMNGSVNKTRVLSWKHANYDLTITVTLRNDTVGGKNWIQIGAMQP